MKKDSKDQTTPCAIDIVIIGGGISGLWLLNRLRDQHYSAILLESNELGSGQTHKAQGIIHGGMKYALQGVLTPATTSISHMPAHWHACLKGQGDIDLTHVPVLSARQYLWSNGNLAAKLAGKVASFTLQSSMHALKKAEYPAIFQHPDFQGDVYSLDEMVIDTHALVAELAKKHHDAIFKIDTLQKNDFEFDARKRLTSLHIHAGSEHALTLHAKYYIFTAGSGNQLIVDQLNEDAVSMQTRPLHMSIVKHTIKEPVFAHCLGLSSTPRITITSHRADDGKYIWYIGGHIAEEGVKRTSCEQIDRVRTELKTLFPWLSFDDATYATFFIDRAEGREKNGARPDSFIMQTVENTIVAWPTKLALAPALAAAINKTINETLTPQPANLHALDQWPHPVIAKPIWDQLLC